MIEMRSIQPSFTDSLFGSWKDHLQPIREWAEGSIARITTLPDQMQKYSNVAITVFTIANTIFFFFMNYCMNRLEHRVYSAPKKLSSGDRMFNHILINIVLGSATILFNMCLSYLTKYPLSKTILAAIGVATIAARTLCHYIARGNRQIPLLENDLEELLEIKTAGGPEKKGQNKVEEEETLFYSNMEDRKTEKIKVVEEGEDIFD